MRRVFLLIVVAGLAATTPVLAQSRPHMELVRGLRSNGLADLALVYLDELKASKPTPDIIVILPLEYARTRLALAALENDDAKRNQILTTARAEFDTFIKSNPTHPQTPFANIDVARLNGLRGKTLYSKARWVSDPKLKLIKMTEARKLFVDATKQYKGTLVAIEKQANKTPELESLELAAKLDQAINLYDTAQTYDEDSEGASKRADDLEAARKILEKIMLMEGDPLSWVARAWLAQITFDLGDAAAAKVELNNIIVKQRNNPKAQTGIRVARYWRIFQNIDSRGFSKATPQAQLQLTIDDATSWLSTYRAYQNTPEGVGALFTRATKRYKLAMYGVIYDKTNKTKIAKIVPSSIKLMEEAEKDFKELMETENEYADQSNTFRNQILVAIEDQVEQTKGDIDPAALGTFEKCYKAAQIQISRMFQYSKQTNPTPTEEQIQAEQKRRYKKAIEFLEYALAHTGPTDPVREVFSAQLSLITYYFRLHLYQQAAILAEHVARTNPRAVKAPMVAGYAMDCYGMAHTADKNKAGATPEVLDTDLDRRREVARYIVSTWPDAPGTDFSRHVLAKQFALDQKPENAMQFYQAIRPAYHNFPSVCLEMSGTLFKMVRPNETDPMQFYKKAKDNIAKHQLIWDKSIQMLKSLPVPTEETVATAIEEAKEKSGKKDDPAFEHSIAGSFVNPYFNAQSNLALLYQLQGKTAEAKALGEAMLALVGKLTKLQGDTKVNYTFKAKTIIYKSLASECADLSKQKKYPDIAEKLDPLIGQMEKDFADTKAATDPPKDYRDSQRQVIVMALQSAVQDRKIARATDLLNLLEKSGGSTEGNFGMMRSLAGTIRAQLDGLREELKKNPKDKEKKDEIDNLAKTFTEFLNQIAPKANDIKDEAGKIEMKIFLAQGYSSVDSYAEATKLLAPVRANLKTMKIPDDQKETMVRKKKQVDFALLHNYRLGKQYDEAEAVFKEVIGPAGPNGKGPPPVALRGWGYSVPMVRKERALLKEEVALSWNKVKPSKIAKWKEAFDEWADIKKAFAGTIPKMDETSPTLVKDFHFMWVGGGVLRTTNPISIALRDKIRAKVDEVARKRSTFFDIFLDQSHCYLKAYHALDAAKYDAQIGKIAHTMAEFHAKNPDLSPEQLERIQAIVNEYPKTFKPKFLEADAELNPKSKSK